MPNLGIIASSNSFQYRLAQTYPFGGSTGSNTYTVPNGVYQIAVIVIAPGGGGKLGEVAANYGGAGGPAGGGGACIAFWNWNVAAGQTFTASRSSNQVLFSQGGNSVIAIAGGNGVESSSGGTGGSGGTTMAAGHGFLPNRTFANGGAGGQGGARQTVNGNGNNGVSGVAGTQLWDPSWAALGLPNNIYSGNGGGGGGGGARDASGTNFFSGGLPGDAGDPITSGGYGGSAFQDGFLQGGNAMGTAVFGEISPNGGNGSGGGAYQISFGNGNPGNISDWGFTGGVYVYER